MLSITQHKTFLPYPGQQRLNNDRQPKSSEEICVIVLPPKKITKKSPFYLRCKRGMEESHFSTRESCRGSRPCHPCRRRRSHTHYTICNTNDGNDDDDDGPGTTGHALSPQTQ